MLTLVFGVSMFWNVSLNFIYIIVRHVAVHVFDFLLTHSNKSMIIELAWG